MRSAIAAGDYRRLFQLWGRAPRSTCLGDLLASKLDWLRLEAAKTIVKAFRPSVPVAWVAKELGFTVEAAIARSKDASGVVALTSANLQDEGRGNNEEEEEEEEEGRGGEGEEGCGAQVSEDEVNAAAKWLRDHGAILMEGGVGGTSSLPSSRPGTPGVQADTTAGAGGAGGLASEGTIGLMLDCRSSVGKLREAEKKNAVAHGDEKMSIEKFLQKAVVG